MARIRSIKPEFPQSESIGRISRDARLLFVMVWTICDDEGRTRGNSRMLASLLYPYDDDAPQLIDAWLTELEREGCVVRYTVNGATYMQVCNWLKHQKIDHASRSKIPPPCEDSRGFASASETLAPDQGSRIGSDQGVDQGSAREDAREDERSAAKRAPREKLDALQHLVDRGVDEAVARDWLALRKAKRAVVTPTAIDGIAREAKAASVSLTDALATCCERGWTGFKAEWVTERQCAPPAKMVVHDERAHTLAVLTGRVAAADRGATGATFNAEARRVDE